jgi:hypothetical protein
MNPAKFHDTLRKLRKTHRRASAKCERNITPAELVKRWDCAYSLGTLANWRQRKFGGEGGPKFIKVAGRVLYPLDKLEAFELATLLGMECGR